jgi:hypothetical protein
VDSGLAAIIGACIGGTIGLVGTLGSIAFKHFLETRRSAGLDKIRKERLIKMLSGEKFTWRSIENLSSAIGGTKRPPLPFFSKLGRENL